MNKKKFAHLKMKFSIQEAGGEKQIFFTFKDASEKTGISSKNILRVLKSEETNISEDPTKKLFGFRMKKKLHLYRSMEKIFSPLKKFRRDLEFLERFFLVNWQKRKLTSWIRRKNLMKLRGNLMIWRNLLVF